MLNITIRHKAKQFSRLVRESALHRRTGQTRPPVLAARDELGLTFIGHSSFFVQIGGVSCAIDPNFAKWLVFLKRLRRPGTLVRHLPPLDAVLITHAHFDHLHKPSLREIVRFTKQQSGRAPVAIVPKGVGDVIVDLGFKSIVELAWWQQVQVHGEHGSCTVTHTPARHWGARMLKDFHRGFGGYVLRAGDHSVYHAGDTAYFDGFNDIGERLRPEIALMPIGAYSPESYRNVHASPEDALRGFVEMRARWFVPMHFGTFRLSREPMDEPIERLLSGARDMGIEDRMLVLEEGVTRIFHSNEPARKHTESVSPKRRRA